MFFDERIFFWTFFMFDLFIIKLKTQRYWYEKTYTVHVHILYIFIILMYKKYNQHFFKFLSINNNYNFEYATFILPIYYSFLIKVVQTIILQCKLTQV